MFDFLGLDDYPRASHPSNEERHLDLRCWMTLFAKVMVKLGSLVSENIQSNLSNEVNQIKIDQVRSMISDYTHWANLLSDLDQFDRLHWSDEYKRFADYGLHTDAVHLEVRRDQTMNKPTNGDQVSQEIIGL